MSDAFDIPNDMVAAEHALGVLTGAERAAAERRMAADPAFAAQVEAWRERFAPLIDEIASTPPSAGLWARIERALPANDDAGSSRGVRFWRRATAGSLGLAAASLAVAAILASRPPQIIVPPPPIPPPLLNASLSGEAGDRPLFVAAYDPERKALLITSLVPPGGDPAHVHQLWLIPADGKPRSLGMVEPGTSKSMPMPSDMAPMFAVGAALAVSVEPPGGSPNKDGPSGPVAAVGKLARI
jgi:anti-sigma-K factor RskA